jgi:hypothetical protein
MEWLGLKPVCEPSNALFSGYVVDFRMSKIMSLVGLRLSEMDPHKHRWPALELNFRAKKPSNLAVPYRP